MKNSGENIEQDSNVKVTAAGNAAAKEAIAPAAFDAGDTWPDKRQARQTDVSATPHGKNELSLAAAERQIAAFFAVK